VPSLSARDQAGLGHRLQVKETVGGIMGSAEQATSDTASKAAEQVCATRMTRLRDTWACAQ